MTISFPVNTPTSSIKEASIELSLDTKIAISRNPFTFQSQVQEYDGAAWILSVSLPIMDREDAAPWFAFLASLRGQRGTFLFGPHLLSSALGSPGGTPRVNGASQEGYSLVSDGWSNSTLVLKAGDFFQIDNSLYMAVSDSTTNGSGQVTIDVSPRLKGHADNSLITTSSPKGVWRLRKNDISLVDVGTSQLYAISFDAEEAL